MKHSKQTNILQWITACCLLTACWACSSEVTEGGLLAEEGTPVKIMAEIQELTQTKAAVVENSYDRTSFIDGDKIRVNRIEGNASAQRVDYTYTAGSPNTWTTTAEPIVLKAGSKYEATYPSDYTNILQDQSKLDGSDFLRSNLLKSGQITSRDGVLRFTEANGGAFTHQNVKLTLVFKVSTGSLAGDFTTALLSAPGLITGGNNTENITLFRPDDAAYTWCGIVYPKGGSGTTDLALQLTYQGVVYKATLSCGLAAGTHYTYTLTLKNDILVPEGSTIDDWKTDPNGDYTGDFDKTT